MMGKEWGKKCIWGWGLEQLENIMKKQDKKNNWEEKIQEGRKYYKKKINRQIISHPFMLTENLQQEIFKGQGVQKHINSHSISNVWKRSQVICAAITILTWNGKGVGSFMK